MTQKTEILGMLRNRVPVKEIRAKFKSKSTLYDCLSEYVEELADKAQRARDASAAEGAKLEAIKTDVTGLAAERDELDNCVRALRSEKEDLTAQGERLRKKRDVLRNEMAAAKRRGFTPEILSRLKTALDKDGAEVDAFLATHEETSGLQKEVDLLIETKTGLTGEVGLLERKKERAQKKYTNLRNRLDLLQASASAFQKAVEHAKEIAENAIASIGVQARDEVIRVASESEGRVKTVTDAVSTAFVRAIESAAEMEQQKNELKDLLRPARALADILYSADELQAVEPSLVALILERFVLYSEQRYPRAFVNAMYDSVANEFVVNPPFPSLIRLSNVIKLAAEGFRSCMIREERERQSRREGA
jgi:chromosome segregation ATPase